MSFEERISRIIISHHISFFFYSLICVHWNLCEFDGLLLAIQFFCVAVCDWLTDFMSVVKGTTSVKVRSANNEVRPHNSLFDKRDHHDSFFRFDSSFFSLIFLNWRTESEAVTSQDRSRWAIKENIKFHSFLFESILIWVVLNDFLSLSVAWSSLDLGNKVIEIKYKYSNLFAKSNK